jgi:hypothetical protein
MLIGVVFRAGGSLLLGSGGLDRGAEELHQRYQLSLYWRNDPFATCIVFPRMNAWVWVVEIPGNHACDAPYMRVCLAPYAAGLMVPFFFLAVMGLCFSTVIYYSEKEVEGTAFTSIPISIW